MRTQPIPLVGGAYTDETRPWSQQDCVNYLPCSAERAGTRSGAMLKTPPGLAPYLEIPPTVTEVGLIPSRPVRGTHNAEGRFFAVIGTTLYQVSNTGVAIPLGTVPGIGRVSFDHNQISLGNQVMVVNGSAGYVYNTLTADFERITDPGFPGTATVKFIGGYMVGIEPQGRYAFSSAVADALNYSTLDRFTSEYAPDRLVGLAAVGGTLFLLSTNTGEFFKATANAQQPFRTTGIYIDKGCAGPYTVVEADNSVFWLGSDGYFYRLNSYSAVRISTRPIEQAIRGLNWSQAFGFVWEDAGHTVIYWTFPDGQTWGWDVPEGDWHRRESYQLSRWRANTMTRWNEDWYAGDFQTGRIWRMDWNYIMEGEQQFISERTIAVIHDNQNAVLIPRMELVMDTGQQVTTPVDFPVQPVGPTVSGDSPNTYIGEDYSFPYTITEGDAPVTSVTIRSGDLPTGSAITNAGVLTVPTTATGTFSYVIRATDANGLFYDHPDTITITSAYWMLRTDGGLLGKLWVSGDLDNWAELDRGPATQVTPNWGKQMSDGSVLITSLTSAAERVSNPTQAGVVTTAAVTIAANTRMIRNFESADASIIEELHSLGQNYYVTENGGLSNTTVTMDSGLKIHGIQRLANGRWIGYRELGSNFRFVYSNADIPLSDADWINGTVPSPGARSYFLTFVEGDTGYCCQTLSGLAKTDGGIAWTNTSPVGLQSMDVRDGVAFDDTLIIVGQGAAGSQHLARSTNRGSTFTAFAFPGYSSIERIERSLEGLLVIAGQAASAGQVICHKSDDEGVNWDPATMPFTVGSSNRITVFPVAGL